MEPISAIANTWECVKVASSLGKALVDLKIEGEVRAKVIAMNDALLEAQQRMFEVQTSHAEMAEKVRKLEEELAKYQSWEREKKRYELQKTEAGGQVYRLKPDMADGEEAHDLCPNCYQEGVKIILQPSDSRSHQTLVCHRCSAEIRLAPGGMHISPAALEMARRKP